MSNRSHTLAFVPKAGRLYSFGQGGSGQLGIDSLDNKNSPFLVKGPWKSTASGSSSMQVDNEAADLSVKHIFCGGDQSFVVTHNSDVSDSVSFRISFFFLQSFIFKLFPFLIQFNSFLSQGEILFVCVISCSLFSLDVFICC